MKLYGLIGKDLKHSFSSQWFTQKFEKEGINAEYQNFELNDIYMFESLISEYSLTGLNVTIPYKQEIIPFLSHMSPEAQEIGAVNVIQFTDRGLIGHNTDHLGFRQSIESLITHQKRALIFGTGGASKAIVYALRSMGLESTLVSSSNPEFQNYQSIDSNTIAEHEILVNCTPLGTLGNEKTCVDIPYQAISSKHIAFDVVYNPSKSLFLQKCEAQGAQILNGYDMLVNQAELSWKIWNI